MTYVKKERERNRKLEVPHRHLPAEVESITGHRLYATVPFRFYLCRLYLVSDDDSLAVAIHFFQLLVEFVDLSVGEYSDG